MQLLIHAQTSMVVYLCYDMDAAEVKAYISNYIP